MSALSLTTTPSGCLYVEGSKTRNFQAACIDGTTRTAVTPGQLVLEAYYKIEFPRNAGKFYTMNTCWDSRCVHPWHRIPERAKKFVPEDQIKAWRAARAYILEHPIPGVAHAFDPRIAALPQRAFETLAAQSGVHPLPLYLAWAELLKADYRNQRYAGAGKTPRDPPLSKWLAETRPDLFSFSTCGVPQDLDIDDWNSPFPCGLESKAIAFVDAEQKPD